MFLSFVVALYFSSNFTCGMLTHGHTEPLTVAIMVTCSVCCLSSGLKFDTPLLLCNNQKNGSIPTQLPLESSPICTTDIPPIDLILKQFINMPISRAKEYQYADRSFNLSQASQTSSLSR